MQYDRNQCSGGGDTSTRLASHFKLQSFEDVNFEKSNFFDSHLDENPLHLRIALYISINNICNTIETNAVVVEIRVLDWQVISSCNPSKM